MFVFSGRSTWISPFTVNCKAMNSETYFWPFNFGSSFFFRGGYWFRYGRWCAPPQILVEQKIKLYENWMKKKMRFSLLKQIECALWLIISIQNVKGIHLKTKKIIISFFSSYLFGNWLRSNLNKLTTADIEDSINCNWNLPNSRNPVDELHSHVHHIHAFTTIVFVSLILSLNFKCN